MLTEQEHAFLIYWNDNRSRQKQRTKQFIVGLAIGLAFGLTILFFIFSGWYTRATMIANSRLSPILFFIIIIAVAVFMAYFYRNYKWEMYEQQYLELTAKKKKTENSNQQNIETDIQPN
jgi:uncharacterized protein YacL